MGLHDLKAPSGANRKRRRIGRGESSNWGKTAGKGHGGQKVRSGKGKPRIGFEGGQVPMYRRMPKRGFTNKFAKAWGAVNLDMLATRFDANDVIDLDSVKAAGLVPNKTEALRILGRCEKLEIALTIRAHHFSARARELVVSAGGKAIEVGSEASANKGAEAEDKDSK